MNQGVYSLAASMINQINRVDVISNNLANANSNGFKQEGLSEGSFNNYLKKAEEANITPTKLNTVLNTIPKIDEKYINNLNGPVVSTANELDFSLNDRNSFFKVKNEKGEILLSRDGGFHTMSNAVVNGSGHQILDPNDEPVASVEGFAATIGLARTEYTNLEKIGNNAYRIINENEVEYIEDNNGILLQGSIEKSNVNSVITMVSLIDAHRRFAQSQKAIEAIGEMSKTAVDKLGRA